MRIWPILSFNVLWWLPRIVKDVLLGSKGDFLGQKKIKSKQGLEVWSIMFRGAKELLSAWVVNSIVKEFFVLCFRFCVEQVIHWCEILWIQLAHTNVFYFPLSCHLTTSTPVYLPVFWLVFLTKLLFCLLKENICYPGPGQVQVPDPNLCDFIDPRNKWNQMVPLLPSKIVLCSSLLNCCELWWSSWLLLDFVSNFSFFLFYLFIHLWAVGSCIVFYVIDVLHVFLTF